MRAHKVVKDLLKVKSGVHPCYGYMGNITLAFCICYGTRFFLGIVTTEAKVNFFAF